MLLLLLLVCEDVRSVRGVWSVCVERSQGNRGAHTPAPGPSVANETRGARALTLCAGGSLE